MLVYAGAYPNKPRETTVELTVFHLRPALQSKKPVYPDTWQAMPAGDELKGIIEAEFNQLCSQFFGYHLVKLGTLSSELQLAKTPIRHHIGLTSQVNPVSGLVSIASGLPFQENSIDAFVLAHELDFAADPHQILREVNHAIIPNGHVAICGYNPFSLAGVARWLPLKRQSLLHEARFFTPHRIRDWLHLLGFEIVVDKRLIFNELLFERQLRWGAQSGSWLARYFSWFASLYIIVGKKREIPLSLAKPQWQPKPKFSAVGVSIRELPEEV